MAKQDGRSIDRGARLPAVVALLLGFAALAVPAAGRAEEVTASGCAQPGIEAGCIELMAKDGRLYNITAAVPKPQPGVAGTVSGTVSEGMSSCMRGITLSPAKWSPEPGAACPAPKQN